VSIWDLFVWLQQKNRQYNLGTSPSKAQTATTDMHRKYRNEINKKSKVNTKSEINKKGEGRTNKSSEVNKKRGGSITRNMRFILLLIKLKLSHMMVFRFNFFGAFIADGLLFLTQVLFFQLIFSQVDRIGDWGSGEMLIFIGTFSMINGLNMLIYFFGVIAIPEKIQTGDLDLYLTKPVNPLLRLTFEQVNPGSFFLLPLSGGIVWFGLRHYKSASS